MKKIFTLITLLISMVLFGKEFKTADNLIRGTLPNGLEYYILKNKKPEKKAILNLVVKAGSVQEEDGTEGIAHIIEHMAFNGTKKYKKNDMIKYLQSIGLNFGGDLNAYTSFEETVYKLILPTDDNSKYEKGIEILREWANEVRFSPEELESEKKIVMEEWRLRQGLNQREGDMRKKALFDNSRYFDRFPIGLTDVIQNTTVDKLRAFYDKWYHPKNMAIIAVGDLDVKKTENLIKKYFNYKPRTSYTKPQQYILNKLKNKYIVFKDPEIVSSTMYISEVIDREIITSEEAYMRSNVQLLLFNILNTRLNNLITEKDSPVTEAIVYADDFNKTSTFVNVGAAFKDQKIKEGVALICTFLNKSINEGITQTELDLEKKNMLNFFKSLVTNKDSITHSRYAEELLQHVLTGESYIGIDEEYKVFQKNMNNIKLDDLNKLLKKVFSEGAVYFLDGSTKNTGVPTEKQLKAIVDKPVISTQMNFNVKEVILPPIDIKNGSIIETHQSKDTVTYKLSNGINVIAKKTNFDKDLIHIRLFKKEGSSTYSYDEFLNSIFACSTVLNSGVHNLSPKDLENFMKGKNFSLSPYISDYEQGFDISTDDASLIPALEYMSYLVREPKIDDAIFKNTIDEVRESIKNRNNSPSVIYRDEINKIYSGSNIRRSPLTLKELSSVTKAKTLNAFKDRFDNFNEYDMVVVGSFDQKKLPGLLEKYFASLPSNSVIGEPKNIGLKVPKNIVTKEVVKGVDKKSTVTLIFPYNYVYGEKERVLYASFARVLTMALIEDIREAIGGVYSISASASLSPNNYGEDRLVISFSCDTKRVNEVKRATLNTVKRMVVSDIDNDKIQSIIKNYALEYRNDVLKNHYWSNYYYQKFTIGDTFKIFTPKEYSKLITKKNLLEFVPKAVKMANYIDVTLIPQREEL